MSPIDLSSGDTATITARVTAGQAMTAAILMAILALLILDLVKHHA